MERVPVEKKVLSENDRIAAELRQRFAEDGTLVLNFISSPGSGKTLFLERTLEGLPKDLRVAVLTGDIQTDNDARRLAVMQPSSSPRISPRTQLSSTDTRPACARTASARRRGS